jgi:hypothetical protein
VNLDRRARERAGPLTESERDKVKRLRANAELAMERDVLKRRCLRVKQAMGRRGVELGAPWLCRVWRWDITGVVSQVAQRRSVATSESVDGVGGDDRLPVTQVRVEQGLVARPKRKRRGTTRPDKLPLKAPDARRPDFTRPRSRTCAGEDLTEITTDDGKLQIATVLDLPARRRVGFAVGVHHHAELARAALAWPSPSAAAR